MQVHNKPTLKGIRRQLRQNMTPAEAALWEKLRNRKFHNTRFTRQHSLGNYIVDFHCAHPRFVIELDGGVHLEPEQKEKDIHRDANLAEMNYVVLRFTNDEILNNIDEVLKRIELIINS